MVSKTWADLLQVLTEDENLRLRKQDIDALWRTDIREFYTHLKQFEQRIDERVEKVNTIKANGKGSS